MHGFLRRFIYYEKEIIKAMLIGLTAAASGAVVTAPAVSVFLPKRCMVSIASFSVRSSICLDNFSFCVKSWSSRNHIGMTSFYYRILVFLALSGSSYHNLR